MSTIPAWLTIDAIFHPRLAEYFPDWENHGIFQTTAMASAPWVNDNTHPIAPAVLDLIYFTVRSGEKLPSPTVKNLADNDLEFGLTAAQVETLGNAIMQIYGIKFGKQWATLKQTYDPIENYRMTEEETSGASTTHGHTITITDNLTHRKSGTVQTADTREDTENTTRTPNTTSSTSTTTTENTTHTPNTREETENSVAGFNSSAMSDQSAQVHTKTGTETQATTTQTTGTNTETGTETQATTNRATGSKTDTYNLSDTDTGTKTHANTGTDSEESERELVRHGNIGVTTSQQMLEQERDLWQWNFVEQVVFPAVDKVLCLPTY